MVRSVGAAGRVLKHSDPNIIAFDLSPDGSTLAYSIPEADDRRLNTFLTDFPAGSRELQVTTSGGVRPRFSGDGKAVFYLAPAVPQTDPPRGALAKRPVTLKSWETSESAFWFWCRTGEQQCNGSARSTPMPHAEATRRRPNRRCAHQTGTPAARNPRPTITVRKRRRP